MTFDSIAEAARRLFLAASVAVAAMAAAPASAAQDPAELDCPVDSLDPAERAQLFEHVRVRGPHEDPIRSRLFESIDRCGERFGWSRSQRQNALLYNIGHVAVRDLRARLSGMNVEAAAIERLVVADEAIIAGMEDSGPSGEQVRAIIRRLDPRLLARLEGPGARDLLDAVADLVIYRSVMEAQRVRFAQ